MNSEELKSIGVSAALILVNIALMAVIAVSPVADISRTLLSLPAIAVMLIFGAGLYAGRSVAKKGVRRDDDSTSAAGTAILQITYGVFGGGLLSYVSPGNFPIALGITALVTTGIAVGAALLVYGTGRNFRTWGKYSNYLFMAALGTGLLGTFFAPILILTFILILIGFIVYLVYEIWRMKQRPGRVLMNGIGIYIAYMGVFVEILQIVISMVIEE